MDHGCAACHLTVGLGFRAYSLEGLGFSGACMQKATKSRPTLVDRTGSPANSARHVLQLSETPMGGRMSRITVALDPKP